MLLALQAWIHAHAVPLYGVAVLLILMAILSDRESTRTPHERALDAANEP